MKQTDIHFHLLSQLKKLARGYSVLYLYKDKIEHATVMTFISKVFAESFFTDNLDEASSYIISSKPDILVIDLDIDKSFEFLADIQSYHISNSIIAIHSQNDTYDLLQSIDLGIGLFVKKPFKVDNILDNLTTIIKNIPLTKEEQYCFNIIKKHKNMDVVALNYFKGLHISDSVKIINISNKSITISLSKKQSVALKYEKHIILKIDKHYILMVLKEFIHSNAVLFRATLLEFKQRNMNLKRLSVDKSFKLNVHYQNRSYELKPLEISVLFLSAYIPNKTLNFNIDDKIDINLGFELETSKHLLHEKQFIKILASGKVIRIRPYKDGYKAVFRLQMTKPNEINLKRYLQQREIEIVNEFRYLVKHA